MTEAKNKSTRGKWIGGIILLLFLALILWLIFAKESDEVDQTAFLQENPVPTSPPTDNSTENPQNMTTIVAFGDSITAGFGLTLPEAYPAQLEQILAENGYKVTMINSGVSGETATGGLKRAPFVADQDPDIVLLALGGNDVLRGIDPAVTEDALSKTIATFQEAGTQVLLAGMYAPDNLGEEYVAKFNAIYPKLAEEFNIPLIPFLLEGVALNPNLNQADGIHPTEEGAKIIAETIFPELKLMLDENR